MKNLFRQIIEAYKEHQATVVCGALAMNGSANLYEVYRALNK